jgi:hypothetical protein
MINYYYEINQGVALFGQEIRYLCITDLKPDTIGWRHLHEEAHNNSRRVWLENANGITLIKSPNSWSNNAMLTIVDQRELTWLKLICRDIESLI